MSDQSRLAGLNIFVIVNNPVDIKRTTLIQALKEQNNTVVVCSNVAYDEIRENYVTASQSCKFDLILVFSWSFINSGGKPFDIPGFKKFWSAIDVNVVVLWDDNPFRWSKIVAASSVVSNKISHFVIDSTVVDKLKSKGISAFYFPIYYVDAGYMTKEKLEYTPDSQVLICGNIADPEQFLNLLPGPSDIRYRLAVKFLDLKKADEQYVDELQFLVDESLELNALDQPHFLAILTGIQRTVDRIRILRRIPPSIRVGVVGHNLSAKEIPATVTRHPGVSHAAIGHLYALPIVQFGTSGWPAACNLRLFQAAAMGGIMLHEDRDDARRHFSPEADGFLYRDTDHLIALMEDALVHKNAYREIAAAAHARFRKEHTVSHRARQFVEIVHQW